MSTNFWKRHPQTFLYPKVVILSRLSFYIFHEKQNSECKNGLVDCPQHDHGLPFCFHKRRRIPASQLKDMNKRFLLSLLQRRDASPPV